MKRILSLLMVLSVFLCACGKNTAPATEPTVPSTSITEPSISVEPVRPDFGLYEPGSDVEVQTGGAVKYFSLSDTDYYAMEFMGDGLLLFSGEEETTLTLLHEQADPVSVTLDHYIYPNNNTMRICEDGLYYFNGNSSEIVHLTSDFSNLSSVPLPEDARSLPTLSSDGKLAYYFSEDALRCLDLSTGISRLLRVSTFQEQESWGLHFDDTVLECYIYDGENSACHYVSTATGELLAAYDVLPALVTLGDRYFAEYLDGESFLGLFGSRDGKPQCLQPAQEQVAVEPMLGLNGCITYETDEEGTSLYYYDLEQGTCSAEVRLADVDAPWHMVADETTGLIWILAHDLSATEQALYCWYFQLSPTEDDTNYVTPYYTALEPDEAGLAQIARQAKELGNRYGLRIWVYEDVLDVMPGDYSYETEHRVYVYEKNLAVLERALSAYPDGFFKKLGKTSANGVLTLSLVHGLYGDNELGSLTTADGIHFWSDGSGYMTLVMGELMEQSFYHEVFHAMDSLVLTNTGAYDNWENLNPKGFAYDYSYINNQFREDYQYLEEDTRAFIDMYAMSFPNEDRARVMEYAMMPDNAAYFASDTMQAKLKTLCAGIREAFGLKNYTEPLLWEQYLK